MTPPVLKTRCVKILAELLNVSVQEVLAVTKIVQVSASVYSNPPPYNDLSGEAPPKCGTFSRLQWYQRVGISIVEVNERVGKSFRSVK